ncbi:MAG: hypothetical protein K2J47_10720 [Ruminococcus sp.]|nr:hypothetical protein [Ruminococcus sp.]
MGSYTDPNTYAENAGNVSLSETKFAQVRDDILKVSFLGKSQYNSNFERINDFMLNGDTQPAVVYSVNPLIISAYSDEMDGVVFLEFPDQLTEMYNLQKGTRLVTSNVYKYGNKAVKDIKVGAGYLKRYSDFTPIVQLFLTDRENYVRRRTMLFGEEVWDMVNRLTEEYSRSGKKARKGFYYLTTVNATVVFGILCIIAGIGIAMLYN